MLIQERSDRVSALAQALTGRASFDRLFRQISYVFPEDAWLTQLDATAPATGDPAAAAAPGTPAESTNLTVQGGTWSHEKVAVVLARLAAVPSLSNVRLTASTRVEPGQGEGAEAGGKPPTGRSSRSSCRPRSERRRRREGARRVPLPACPDRRRDRRGAVVRSRRLVPRRLAEASRRERRAHRARGRADAPGRGGARAPPGRQGRRPRRRHVPARQGDAVERRAVRPRPRAHEARRSLRPHARVDHRRAAGRRRRRPAADAGLRRRARPVRRDHEVPHAHAHSRDRDATARSTRPGASCPCGASRSRSRTPATSRSSTRTSASTRTSTTARSPRSRSRRSPRRSCRPERRPRGARPDGCHGRRTRGTRAQAEDLRRRRRDLPPRPARVPASEASRRVGLDARGAGRRDDCGRGDGARGAGDERRTSVALVDTDRPLVLGPGHLRSFSRFKRKDPFVQQIVQRKASKIGSGGAATGAGSSKRRGTRPKAPSRSFSVGEAAAGATILSVNGVAARARAGRVLPGLRSRLRPRLRAARREDGRRRPPRRQVRERRPADDAAGRQEGRDRELDDRRSVPADARQSRRRQGQAAQADRASDGGIRLQRDQLARSRVDGRDHRDGLRVRARPASPARPSPGSAGARSGGARSTVRRKKVKRARSRSSRASSRR